MKARQLLGGALIITAATFTPLSAVAADTDEHRFDIGAQQLETALKAFSDTANMQFIYIESRIRTIKTQGVKGQLDNNAALDELLKGTGIRYEFTNDNTVRLYFPDEESDAAAEPSLPAGAKQELRSSRALEEVVVTAQKRVESLQDVPIAVSVVSGDKIREAGTTNLQDLSVSVPNLYITESFVGDSMFVRGVGSGQNNLGFEQTVGQVLDGFFYGRSRFSRVSFLDVERVEVLKGPQGSLIGKNTTAGAINITSAKPTDQFEAWLSPTWEFESSEGLSVEGAVSGPLTDNLRARVALSYIDRDGFIKNTTTGDDDVAVEDMVGRISLAWDVAENLDALFQYQYGKLDHEGGNNQFSLCNKTAQQVPGAPVNVNFTGIFTSITPDDCRANYKRSGTAGKYGVDKEGKQTNLDTYALTLNWSLGDYTLTSLTGYAAYDYRDLQDGDRTSVELATLDGFGTLPEFAEDYEQWSQELRLTSPLGERYEYIVGLYYQEKEQETEYLLHFANVAGLAVTRNTFTEEEGSSYAAFGQLTYHLNDQWDITLGGRYTYEEKEARSRQFPTALYTLTPSGCVLPAAGACFRHDIKDDFDEEDFSPVLSVQWRPRDDAMYYASIKRGFKAGGYDHLLVANQATDPNIMDRFHFDAEEVTSYELGAKLTLADGAAQLNAALFRSEFDDLQLGGFLNSTEVINTVTNAGSAISQGVELDLRWRTTERLTIAAALAYLDSSYDDYENAPCFTLQTAGCVNGRQDLSDKKLQFASDWKGTLSAEYVWSLPRGFELTGFAQLAYVDEFPLQADLDPNLWQGGYTKVDARLTLSNEENRWEMSVIGRNLGDKLTSNNGDDVPGQAGTLWRSLDPPMSIALQGVVRF